MILYIVWGKSQEEHDTHLEALMKRLSENNLTLNAAKCKFNEDSIWFYRYTLSKEGISADKAKIAALVNMKEPEDASQLRSFLELATYCERFINNLATIAFFGNEQIDTNRLSTRSKKKLHKIVPLLFMIRLKELE